MEKEVRLFLKGLFQAAVAAADPAACVPLHLPSAPSGRTLVTLICKVSGGVFCKCHPMRCMP